jgi:hypothetical protein
MVVQKTCLQGYNILLISALPVLLSLDVSFDNGMQMKLEHGKMTN